MIGEFFNRMLTYIDNCQCPDSVDMCEQLIDEARPVVAASKDVYEFLYKYCLIKRCELLVNRYSNAE